ncbi:MAG: GNAT family N-acetyltransferase, partial [Ktedonobacteraceae bacterium]|nr:GNAT family N-acetyltransferase [Ktedonobacteraceae bacterium]
LFAFTLRYAQLYGAVYTTPDVAGASCWLLPAHTLTFGSLLRSGALALPFQIGLAAIRRLQSAETYNEAMHQRVIGQPHNYLWLLGVDPASQGRGNGGKLIQVGLERADAAGLPCYLETSNPKNVTLYQKYGFEVAEEGVLPGQGPHVWAMKRMP